MIAPISGLYSYLLREPVGISTKTTTSESSARSIATSLCRRRLVDGHDSGAAEPDVVLQPHLRAVDLSLVGVASQLPRELRALRQARRPERMALRDQASGGVDHPAPAVCRVLVLDELVTLALGRQAERLVGDQLVCGEAVVELDHVDVVRA